MLLFTNLFYLSLLRRFVFKKCQFWGKIFQKSQLRGLQFGMGEWGLNDINFGCSFTFSFTSHVQRHVAALKLSIRSRSRQHFQYYQFVLSDMVALRATFACFVVAALNQLLALCYCRNMAFSFIFSHSSHYLNKITDW